MGDKILLRVEVPFKELAILKRLITSKDYRDLNRSSKEEKVVKNVHCQCI